jgi:AI-2E family transporter
MCIEPIRAAPAGAISRDIVHVLDRRTQTGQRAGAGPVQGRGQIMGNESALLAAAYVASEIVLPLVFAIILKLLLQPALRLLERLHVPRILAALLLILALFGAIVGLGTAISGPAGTWAAKLPEGIPRLQERLSFMREPINTLQRFLQQVEDFGATAPSPNAAASAHQDRPCLPLPRRRRADGENLRARASADR